MRFPCACIGRPVDRDYLTLHWLTCKFQQADMWGKSRRSIYNGKYQIVVPKRRGRIQACPRQWPDSCLFSLSTTTNFKSLTSILYKSMQTTSIIVYIANPW